MVSSEDFEHFELGLLAIKLAYSKVFRGSRSAVGLPVIFFGSLGNMEVVEILTDTRVDGDLGIEVFLGQAKLHAQGQSGDDLLGSRPKVVDPEHLLSRVSLCYDLHIGNLVIIFVNAILQRNGLPVVDFDVFLSIQLVGLLL